MRRIGTRAGGGLALALVLACTGPADAAAKKLEVTPLGRGSVANEKLQKAAPKGGVITDRKALAELWKAWKLRDAVPAVDFRTELVLVVTTRGGKLLPLNATLSAGGDLKVAAAATRDLRPGFRYVIGSVSRAGVKTINGKKLRP
jgi:hypothetical protein